MAVIALYRFGGSDNRRKVGPFLTGGDMVDDGSTDGTAQALGPFMDRIVYLRTENQGPAGARNTGMRAATGDYIAWLDSDDLCRKWGQSLNGELMSTHIYPIC
jgi:GT2 family glycosyltransferase